MAKRDFSYGIIPVRKSERGFEFLIINQSLGHWTFPKGHKEANESDLEAARRELWEETGIDNVEVAFNIEFFAHYNLPANEGGFTDKEVKFFLGFVKDKVVKVPADFEHEILEARWCSVKEAEVLLIRTEWKNLLEEANEYLLANF